MGGMGVHVCSKGSSHRLHRRGRAAAFGAGRVAVLTGRVRYLFYLFLTQMFMLAQHEP